MMVLMLSSAELISEESRPVITHGPFLGHLTSSRAKIWARCSKPGVYRLTAKGIGDHDALVATTSEATLENDMCLVWQVTGLQPGKKYFYEATYQGHQIAGDKDNYFLTPEEVRTPTLTRLVFGSCAQEGDESSAVWRKISTIDPQAVVLLGDTPYIDSTELDVQRSRYGEFASVTAFADLLHNRSFYATWDDHDFGLNDTDGRLQGKENSRRAFIEYHGNPSYGDGEEGIYTKFRRGGVEVFLLDTRYFAGTESSPFAEDQTTLLGKKQWEWLRRELKASTAPFKLLASGIIWNGAVRPNKLDHWANYPYELEALFRFIGKENVSGVVLIGGDIHRSRVLRHETSGTAGYRISEFITSPIGSDVMDNANVPHSALIYDGGEPNAFLLITVDTTVTPQILVADFQNATGRKLFSVRLDAKDLSLQ